MSVRVVLVKQAGKVNSTYVNYTDSSESGLTVFMVMKRYQRLGKLVAIAILLLALSTVLDIQSFKLAEAVVESTKLSTSTSELKKEVIKDSFSDFSPIQEDKTSKLSSKYASFFKDKEVKMEGIFPLPKKRTMKPRWNSKSDIPEMFFKAKENVSPHNFNYIRNPHEFCTDVDQVDLLVMIASASWQFDRRKIIRETWATQTGNGKTLKYLFFIGNDGKPDNHQKLDKEFDEYGDIVEEDFQENYYNLTLKTIGQLKWATHYCPNMKYGLHIDDDVFGQVNEITGWLDTQRNPDNLIGCSKVFHPVVRRDGKWNMPVESYPGNQYPLGCVGWCFVMSANVIQDLYYMSLDTPLIFLEDVTTTGILREKIGIDKVIKMPGNEQWCQHKGWPKDRPVEEKLIESWEELSVKL